VLSGAVTFTDTTNGSLLGTAQLTPLSKQPSFATPVDIPTSGNGSTAAVGDFNNDGAPDFVVFDGSSKLTVFLGDPKHPGSFTAQPSIAVTASQSSAYHFSPLLGDGRFQWRWNA
jgi:hypothetical protein